ncbi:hypothetical protein M5K25_023743 [Dendrobium thyrsiflorum]|uniref:Uncharacterized protein n=1 Tax=Dendrobium thyrsiflorum TaxID=117978 RepID=A0ABD0U024_DENTH
MAAKKVDSLEERPEGEMNQIKETMEERISSKEGQVVDLRDMMKKMLEFQTQTAASEAKGPEVKNTNSEIRREEDEVEIVEGERRRPHMETFQKEDRGGRYGERQGIRGAEQMGADWERQEGYGGRRGADFEGRRCVFEGGLGYGRARGDRETVFSLFSTNSWLGLLANSSIPLGLLANSSISYQCVVGRVVEVDVKDKLSLLCEEVSNGLLIGETCGEVIPASVESPLCFSASTENLELNSIG